jgi:hypothetical protein
MGGHSEGVKVDEFCALRKDKCPCGNEYQKNCTPPPIGWADYFFWQGTKMGVMKKHEAHHLLCIASVTKFIGTNATIQEVVKQTIWCINATTNMFPMPLWGHTIKWYCDLASGGTLLSEVLPPPFANVPQHDYDHNSKGGYTDNVDTEMKALANTIQEKAEESHEAAVAELKTKLNGMSNTFRSTLVTRGSTRSGGTHLAWRKGSEKPESDWYLPFSMATDGVAQKRTFPAPGFDSKVANKIKRLASALVKWSAT